ncbi:hypothetical protein CTAYLR_000542 [Chrysophaeum taylorii]|uniref:Uncharacterized protein n=1 Tax=Chrysophaeum taylorii TaxID=2483200 RepID=A0AAD7XNK5_9STRA|nr:hypothetical protein CTAYLR_000542 [Chrysophaeum taylorii]
MSLLLIVELCRAGDDDEEMRLWEKRVGPVITELERSLCRPKGFDVAVVGQKVFAKPEFLEKEKHRKHALMIASIAEKFPLPDVSYRFSGNSTGECENDDCCLAIAKRDGYKQPGILASIFVVGGLSQVLVIA